MREWDREVRLQSKFRRPASLIILIPILFMFINISVQYWKVDLQERELHDGTIIPQIPGNGRRSLLNTKKQNCTNPAVLDFPHVKFPGGKVGQLFIPFIACVYLYILLARVCDGYFIASIKVICSRIGFSGDVAGATLLAAATSSPELFVNLVGTFVTEGNIGVGTIVGSAVFNILAVPGLCSFFANTKVIKLDYWPLLRDSVIYCGSLFILCLVLQDEIIYWYEAVILLICYSAYLLMMQFNGSIRSKFEKYVLNYNFHRSLDIYDSPVTWPLLNSKQANDHPCSSPLKGEEHSLSEDEGPESIFIWPSGSCILQNVWWVAVWPISFFLACTIPNCRSEKLKKMYILTFIMCVCWIAVGSYLIAWMITISGYVLRIPDSVMGLTFIAAGMCIPETISSIIVSREGEGSMALANSLGSNIFDILFCFGIPWFIKSVYFPDHSLPASRSDGHYIEVSSKGLSYDIVILLTTLAILFTIVALNKFQLTKFTGNMCLVMYFVFIAFSVMIELHVHFTSTLPTCQIDL